MTNKVEKTEVPDVWGWAAQLAALSVPHAEPLRELLFGTGTGEVAQNTLRSASALCVQVLWMEMPDDLAVTALGSCMERSTALLDSVMPGSALPLQRLHFMITDQVEAIFFWSLVCVRFEPNSRASGREEFQAILGNDLTQEIEATLSNSERIERLLLQADLATLNEHELFVLFENDDDRLRDYLSECLNVLTVTAVISKIRQRLSTEKQRLLLSAAYRFLGQNPDEARALLQEI